MVLVIDNYDSFTYNLVQYLGEVGAEVLVRRNDRVTLDGIRDLAPDQIVISPGPGRPESAGISIDVVRELGPRIPILGVCLGIRSSGRCTVARWCVRQRRSMARRPKWNMTGGASFGTRESVRGGSVPLTDCVLRVAARCAGGVGDDGRGHHHGAETPGTSGTRRAVPPGVDIDRHRATAAPEFSGGLMLKPLLEKLIHRQDLSEVEAEGLMTEVMEGRAGASILAGLLTALVMKGERTSEIVGLARTMRARAVSVPVPTGEIFDTCGTRR